MKHYESSFPYCKFKLNEKHKNKPWLSSGMINSIHHKNKLYKKYLSQKNDISKLTYTNYRNKLDKLLKIAKNEYYINKFFEVKNDSKRTWQIVNSLLNKSKRNNYPDSFHSEDGITYTTEKDIANGFNNFFTNIGSNLAGKIPNTDAHFNDYLGQNNLQSIFWTPISTKEIELIVAKFKYKGNCGIDDIDQRVIINTIDIISEPLAHIFNTSLTTGSVPNELKIGQIIPIHKSSDKEQFTNYRPISILPCISKILERLVYIRLSSFLSANKILTNSQFGFRQNCSTEMALSIIVDKLISNIDSNKTTSGVYIDLSKAFDTLDHTILIAKLEHYGIRGISLDWFRDYLRDRKQAVKFNKTISDLNTTNCGVPQGSILGPLLFIIYINDCVKVANSLHFVMFADDTNIFQSDTDIELLNRNMNSELGKLSKWFKANKLSLNISKTKFMLFTRRKNVHPDFKLYIDNREIDRVESMKFLGVLIDEHINWKEHIRLICIKLARSIGVINRLKRFLPFKILKQLYCCLFLSHIQYCILIWGKNSQTVIHPICILQKRIIRVITNSDYRAHTSQLFRNLGLLKYEDILNYKTAIFMYKLEHNDMPDAFSNFIPKNQQRQSYRLRNRGDYSIERSSSKLKSNSLKVFGAKLWNTLPQILRTKKSKYSFKFNYKKLLIERY